MHQKIATKDLKTGMFIADLDRPWIDTPFLLQGFLLEDAEQLQQLCAQCEWVMIDPQLLAGEAIADLQRLNITPPPLSRPE